MHGQAVHRVAPQLIRIQEFFFFLERALRIRFSDETRVVRSERWGKAPPIPVDKVNRGQLYPVTRLGMEPAVA